MPRPNAVRVDTQPRDGPIAADHIHAPSDSSHTMNGYGPSQSQAIRNVTEEQAQAQPQQQHKHQQMGQQEGEELDRELADVEEVAGDSESEDDELDKMSSSPSITDEDIDFELVYALHHFKATVEGQANAAKGEHMVLLDDSNSYWWLVRIVRDSSVGYLPAEHIETGNERLARLNKHRNIDLAANMLSDSSPEKIRNPLKKAMRRRNAKTVVFTDPIYHEASEYEYSSEEEGEEGECAEGEYEGEGGNVEVHREAAGTDSSAKGNTNGALKDAAETVGKVKKAPVSVLNPPSDPRTSSESSGSSRKGSEDSIKLRPNPAPLALRHPDSVIFRDENTGTKKLTLTPNLLRDDDTSTNPTKPEVSKGSSSLDREGQRPRAEGVLSPPPGKTGGRLRKGSVLGNLFKKRNKKGRKDEEEEVEEWLAQAAEKKSLDSTRSGDTPKESPNGWGEETRKQGEEAQLVEAQRRQQEAQRQQQQERPREDEQTDRETQRRAQQATAVTASTIRRVESVEARNSPSSALQAPYRQQSPVETRKPEPQQDLNVQVPDQSRARSPNVAPIDTNVWSHPQQRKVSVSEERPAYSPMRYQPARQQDFSRQQDYQQERIVERLSESPEQITFHDAAERPDTSSGDETSSLEMIDRSSTFETTTTSPGSGEESGHTITRTWSDWSLRTYFEEDDDVKDMLIVVQQDKGEISPQKQHPEIAPLFADSSRRLDDITKQLDGMLGQWMSRRRARR